MLRFASSTLLSCKQRGLIIKQSQKSKELLLLKNTFYSASCVLHYRIFYKSSKPSPFLCFQAPKTPSSLFSQKRTFSATLGEQNSSKPSTQDISVLEEKIVKTTEVLEEIQNEIRKLNEEIRDVEMSLSTVNTTMEEKKLLDKLQFLRHNVETREKRSTSLHEERKILHEEKKILLEEKKILLEERKILQERILLGEKKEVKLIPPEFYEEGIRMNPKAEWKWDLDSEGSFDLDLFFSAMENATIELITCRNTDGQLQIDKQIIEIGEDSVENKELLDFEKEKEENDRVLVIKFPENFTLCGQKEIFVRNFYEDLFASLLQDKNSLVIGNPGIGKSWFHWYILFRFIRAKDFALPDGKLFGSKKLPKVIIRQVGKQSVEIYLLEHRKVYRTSGSIPEKIIEFFHSDHTLCLFEPGKDFCRVVGTDTDIPMIATVSPDIRRYKEWQKQCRARYKYMPTWSLEELLCISDYIQLDDNGAPHQQDKRKLIEENYRTFGGILRHITATGQDKEILLEKQREVAKKFARTLVDLLPSQNTPEELDTSLQSHFALQFNVIRTPGPSQFKKVKSIWTSVGIQNEILEKVSEEEFGRFLKRVSGMFTGSEGVDCHAVETFVSFALTKKSYSDHLGLTEEWYEYLLPEGDNEKKEKFKFPEFTHRDFCSKETTLEHLEPNVFYQPKNKVFPIVDSLFIKDGEPCGLQVTLAKEHGKKRSTFEKFLRGLGFKLGDPEEKRIFHIFYVVPSNNINLYASKLEEIGFFVTNNNKEGSEKEDSKKEGSKKKRTPKELPVAFHILSNSIIFPPNTVQREDKESSGENEKVDAKSNNNNNE